MAELMSHTRESGSRTAATEEYVSLINLAGKGERTFAEVEGDGVG
jgi:hypothetical protein